MKYQSIQLLRAIAALMVVIRHSQIAFSPTEKMQLWWWPGVSDFGYMGVSLFFVISGFIIANVLSRPNFELGDYFFRRFLRIYPLYWLVMGIGLYFYITRNWFKYPVDTLGREGMIKSFLIFPMKEHPFWEPGWSLEHEVMFYIIAAVITSRLGLRWLAITMIFLGLIGKVFTIKWDYHLFNSAQMFFGAGVVAYLLKDQAYAWYKAFPVALGFLSLTYGQFYGLLQLGDKLAGVAFAIGASSLVVGLIDLERRGCQMPRALVLIGDASFSLYLWHWLIIPVVATCCKHIGGAPEFWRWIIVFVSIKVAIISYYLIEKPLIFFSHRKLREQAKI